MTFSNQRRLETHTDDNVFVNSTCIVSIISEDEIICVLMNMCCMFISRGMFGKPTV